VSSFVLFGRPVSLGVYALHTQPQAPPGPWRARAEDRNKLSATGDTSDTSRGALSKTFRRVSTIFQATRA